MIGTRNFQDTFEIRQRSPISAFSICMTVPLMSFQSGFRINFCAIKRNTPKV